MKNFIILIIFSFNLSLYSSGEDSLFGINYSVYEQVYSFNDDKEYKEKYKASMNLIAEAGIKWWRAQFAFRWCDVENKKGRWNFDTEDSLVKWAGERGLHLLPSIGYTAAWAKHPNTKALNWENKYRYPPDTLKWDEYKHYIAKLVERYDGDGKDDMQGLDSVIPIKYWECMNEPYHKYFLGTPKQYVEMFESTRVVLKRADPVSKIVGPCMTTRKGPFEWIYFDTTCNSIRISDFGYKNWKEAIRSLIIDSIGLNNIDVISHHIYNNTANFIKYTKELRNIVGEDKPIWITETGFNRTDLFKAERGTGKFCPLSTCVTYSSDSGEPFWDYVLVRRGNNYEKPCTTMIDTFLNVGDTVILEKRTDNYAKDTIIYNGGNLIYKNKDTALAIGDTLRVLDIWDADYLHTEKRQDSLYSELLDSIFNTPTFLKNLKVFFYDASNTPNKYAYPPRIEFGNRPNDTSYIPTRYHRQLVHNTWSIINNDNNPYPAYYTIKSYIQSIEKKR
jgi:hypothetical protein